MISIAGFRRALSYFWVFGIVSVLLDLDHIIRVYQDGLEFNIENLAYHGTRTLHIPILIMIMMYKIIRVGKYSGIEMEFYELTSMIHSLLMKQKLSLVIFGISRFV